MSIIEILGWLIAALFGFVLTWFFVGMAINFYKIYIKKKAVRKPEELDEYLN